MKKLIRLMAFFVAASALVLVQSCDDEEPAVPPTLTAPTGVTAVQVNAKADISFSFLAPEGYASSSVSATGGSATVKTAPAAGATEGSVVVEFTADGSAGAASVTLTLTDNKSQTISQTAVVNKTISAPPTVALSASTANGFPGKTVSVTVTVTAANGAKSLAYTTTGGLTGSPASPITLSGTTQAITFTIPASAAIGATFAVAITATDNQNLNSTPATFTVTAATNVLTGTLSTNLTVRKGEPYLVTGQFIVATGVTLTVEPGAIIKGDKATKGLILIQPGGKLNAVGTAAEPIVFTSSQNVGERDRGDWAGIVWLGNAYVNQSARPAIEGVTPTQLYGTVGTDVDVNSTEDNGKLRYARIEYAGIELTPNNETNGLTMGGLGSGTEVDYVQVSYGGDDAFEWFGGTVNGKHLVSLSTWDDDFDTDFGWRGNVQWGLIVRNPFFADQSGSCAFESDNQANANAITGICDDTEKKGCTGGVFSNVTVLGPREFNRTISGNYTRALHLRRRTAISIFNSVITGFNTGLTIDDAGTLTNYKADNTGFAKLNNNVLFTSLLPGTPTPSGGPFTAIPAASGNAAFGSTDASNIWNGSSSGNTSTVPAFFVRTGSTSASNTWASTASTVAGTDVAFATVAGWTAGTAVNIINPYEGTGINPALFFAGQTAATYPANPNFAVTSGSITGQTAATLFADAKLGSFFDKTLTYKGAFGATDWTDGWADFQPVNKVY